MFINQMTHGQKIRQIRNRLKLSQEEFAAKIGSSTGYIGNVETGARKPGRDLIERIIHTFNIDPSEFFKTPAAAEAGTAYAPGEEMPQLDTLGQRLRYFREEILGATHREFAKGTPARMEDVAAFELDEAIPDARFLTALHSKYHEVLEEPLLEWLLGGRAAPRPKTQYLMREILAEVERFLKKEGLSLSADKKSELVAALYDEAYRGRTGRKDIRRKVRESLRKAS